MKTRRGTLAVRERTPRRRAAGDPDRATVRWLTQRDLAVAIEAAAVELGRPAPAVGYSPWGIAPGELVRRLSHLTVLN